MSEIQGSEGGDQKKSFVSRIGHFFSREGQMEADMRFLRKYKAELGAKKEAAESDATDSQKADAEKIEEIRKEL